jgi:5-methylcytosine-specific restriction endonuclease McrA
MPASDDRDEHVCILDVYERGIKGCRCGRWFMPVSGQWLTIAFVSPDLRDRAREYRTAISLGEFPDLRAAVADHHHKALRERHRANIKLRERWEARQRNAYARFISAVSEILLTPDAKCAYCGAPARTLDHVLPRSRWPELERRFSNLAPACKRCNPAKSNRTVDEWRAARLKRGLPWPPEIPDVQYAAG